jgi:hypothetical protein
MPGGLCWLYGLQEVTTALPDSQDGGGGRWGGRACGLALWTLLSRMEQSGWGLRLEPGPGNPQGSDSKIGHPGSPLPGLLQQEVGQGAVCTCPVFRCM